MGSGAGAALTVVCGPVTTSDSTTMSPSPVAVVSGAAAALDDGRVATRLGGVGVVGVVGCSAAGAEEWDSSGAGAAAISPTRVNTTSSGAGAGAGTGGKMADGTVGVTSAAGVAVAAILVGVGVVAGGLASATGSGAVGAGTVGPTAENGRVGVASAAGAAATAVSLGVTTAAGSAAGPVVLGATGPAAIESCSSAVVPVGARASTAEPSCSRYLPVSSCHSAGREALDAPIHIASKRIGSWYRVFMMIYTTPTAVLCCLDQVQLQRQYCRGRQDDTPNTTSAESQRLLHDVYKYGNQAGVTVDQPEPEWPREYSVSLPRNRTARWVVTDIAVIGTFIKFVK